MTLSIEHLFFPSLWEAEGKISVSERGVALVWSPGRVGVGGVDAVHRKEWFTSLQPSAPIINTMDHRRAHLPSPIWTTPSPVRRPLSPSLAGTSVSCTKPPGRRRFTWCHSAQSSRGVAMHRFFGRKCVTFVVRYHTDRDIIVRSDDHANTRRRSLNSRQRISAWDRTWCIAFARTVCMFAIVKPYRKPYHKPGLLWLTVYITKGAFCRRRGIGCSK